MSRLPANLLELPLEQRAIMALRAAVREVIEENARRGLPLYIWSRGKVVAVPAKKLLARSRRRRSKK